ncbi:hypothetical protein DRP05_03565 [Archaeoglobales archaeon]|nr:MAG: hypothetical protein DRP05_03565 [Archaeoglobales archaeon]
MRWLKLAVIVTFLLLIPANAQPVKVESISNYNMIIEVNGDVVHVKNNITLKNLINKPIVPGIGEIRLQKVSPQKIGFISIPFTKEVKPVKVENLKGYKSDGDKIEVKVEDKKDYTIIHYEIWYPIEPGKELTFVIEYDSSDLIEKGLLFKTLKVPVGADLDVERLKLEIKSDWKITYTDPEMSSYWEASIPAGSIAFFTAELSILPLPKTPFSSYIMFWTAIIVLVVLLALVVRKRGKT